MVGGESYSGKFFEMTADIDAEGISVGASDKPFSGTISGGMHTLTYNAGTIVVYREGDNAPAPAVTILWCYRCEHSNPGLTAGS